MRFCETCPRLSLSRAGCMLTEKARCAFRKIQEVMFESGAGRHGQAHGNNQVDKESVMQLSKAGSFGLEVHLMVIFARSSGKPEPAL